MREGYVPTWRTPLDLKEVTEKYEAKLQAMSDADLFKESESMVWFSAFAANNAKSDYHWQVDACSDECRRRGKPEIYDQAWKKASRMG